jgi:hypothetical protein
MELNMNIDVLKTFATNKLNTLEQAMIVAMNEGNIERYASLEAEFNETKITITQLNSIGV